jgi:hypothetical protein
MPELPNAAAVPDAMPVLGRGSHKNPSRGACFMEYTSLLAGETFTDEPGCVDRELAAVLRGANDKLSNAERPLLLPLLGRAIGLSAGSPPPRGGAWRRSAADRRRRREELSGYHHRAGRLRRAAARRFLDALSPLSAPASELWSRGSEDLSWLFWDLMSEPAPLNTSEQYVQRLIDRLHLLHESYEQAMADLGLPRAGGREASAGTDAADRSAPEQPGVARA